MWGVCETRERLFGLFQQRPRFCLFCCCQFLFFGALSFKSVIIESFKCSWFRPRFLWEAKRVKCPCAQKGYRAPSQRAQISGSGTPGRPGQRAQQLRHATARVVSRMDRRSDRPWVLETSEKREFLFEKVRVARFKARSSFWLLDAWRHVFL